MFFSQKVRSALFEHVKKADKDPAVKAIVICGKRKIFCAGADIKEFDGVKKGMLL